MYRIYVYHEPHIPTSPKHDKSETREIQVVVIPTPPGREATLLARYASHWCRGYTPAETWPRPKITRHRHSHEAGTSRQCSVENAKRSGDNGLSDDNLSRGDKCFGVLSCKALVRKQWFHNGLDIHCGAVVAAV